VACDIHWRNPVFDRRVVLKLRRFDDHGGTSLMTRSTAQRIAYHLFALTLILLMLSAGAGLLTVLRLLPDALLAAQLPQIDATLLLTLAIHLGLITSAVYIFADTPTTLINTQQNHSKWRGLRISLIAGLTMSILFPAWRLQLGYPLAAVAPAFWLMRRFSHVRPEWAALGLRSVSGLLAVAGLLAILAPLHPLIGLAAAAFIPLAYMIFAAHTHRAFSDPNANRTLAAYWLALAILLFLLANGVMGALHTFEAVRRWTDGTRIEDLQTWLSLWAMMALILGVINQAGAELRGENRWITGLLPYWCIAFGTFGASLALFSVGLVEIYLTRVLTIGAMETAAYSKPLVLFWLFGLFWQALGILFYALGFWARRPIIHKESAHDAMDG